MNESEFFAEPSNSYAFVLGVDFSQASEPAVREAIHLMGAVKEPTLHVVHAAGAR